MAISHETKKAFAALVHVIEGSQEVCLVEATDKVTGKPAHVICVTGPGETGLEFIPVAQFFSPGTTDNPYDRFEMPANMSPLTSPEVFAAPGVVKGMLAGMREAGVLRGPDAARLTGLVDAVTGKKGPGSILN